MSHQSERRIDIYREKNLISVEFWTSLNDLIAKESITFKYGRITVFYIYKLEVITRITVDFLCNIGWYRIDHRKQISILNTAVFKVYKSSLHNQKFWENLEKLKSLKYQPYSWQNISQIGRTQKTSYFQHIFGPRLINSWKWVLYSFSKKQFRYNFKFYRNINLSFLSIPVSQFHFKLFLLISDF